MSENHSQETDDETDVQLRLRLIESIELWTDSKAQLDYQDSVPIADVSSELVEQWYDIAHSKYLETVGPPNYKKAEITALRHFDTAMAHFCKTTPSRLPPIEELQTMEQFHLIKKEAQRALAAFSQ